MEWIQPTKVTDDMSFSGHLYALVANVVCCCFAFSRMSCDADICKLSKLKSVVMAEMSTKSTFEFNHPSIHPSGAHPSTSTHRCTYHEMSLRTIAAYWVKEEISPDALPFQFCVSHIDLYIQLQLGRFLSSFSFADRNK